MSPHAARPYAMHDTTEMERRIDAHFDAVMEIARRIQQQMVADGLIRSPEARTRLGEAA